jgi:uncharacterized protein
MAQRLLPLLAACLAAGPAARAQEPLAALRPPARTFLGAMLSTGAAAAAGVCPRLGALPPDPRLAGARSAPPRRVDSGRRINRGSAMSAPGVGQTDFRQVVRAAKGRFALGLHGLHGVPHWQRVRENGLRLAKHTGANRLLVELFAYLHDCCREDDRSDPGHGERAADFAESLRGTVIHLGAEDFSLLRVAIRDHELGLTRGDVTVLTCWDADRLDLGRVRVRPNPRFLGTAYARRKEIIEWAYKWSRAD